MDEFSTIPPGPQPDVRHNGLWLTEGTVKMRLRREINQSLLPFCYCENKSGLFNFCNNVWNQKKRKTFCSDDM